MRLAFQIIAAVCLVAAVAPAVGYLVGALSLTQAQLITLLATLGWFVHAPLAGGRSKTA